MSGSIVRDMPAYFDPVTGRLQGFIDLNAKEQPIGNGTGDMVAGANLADVADPAVARTNLGAAAATDLAATAAGLASTAADLDALTAVVATLPTEGGGASAFTELADAASVNLPAVNTSVAAIKTTADTAASTASTAASTASTAATQAGTALSTAITAATNAATAVGTANTAASTANTAATNASSAVTTANTAAANASTAATNAATAVNTASSAATSASAANTTAASATSTAAGATSTANAAATAATNAAAAAASAAALAATKADRLSNVSVAGDATLTDAAHANRSISWTGSSPATLTSAFAIEGNIAEVSNNGSARVTFANVLAASGKRLYLDPNETGGFKFTGGSSKSYIDAPGGSSGGTAGYSISSNTGTFLTGAVLTAVIPDGVFGTYQWTRDGANITSGGTSSTYTLVSADAGTTTSYKFTPTYYFPTGVSSGASPDVTPPTLTTAAVSNATPAHINLTWSEAIDSSSIASPSAFAVSAGHVLTAHTYVDSTHTYLTTATPFVNGEAARTLAYTQPSTGKIKDIAGNQTASFSGHSITNSVAAGAGMISASAADWSNLESLDACTEYVIYGLTGTAPTGNAYSDTVNNFAGINPTFSGVDWAPAGSYYIGDNHLLSYTRNGSNNVEFLSTQLSVDGDPRTVTFTLPSNANAGNMFRLYLIADFGAGHPDRGVTITLADGSASPQFVPIGVDGGLIRRRLDVTYNGNSSSTMTVSIYMPGYVYNWTLVAAMLTVA